MQGIPRSYYLTMIRGWQLICKFRLIETLYTFDNLCAHAPVLNVKYACVNKERMNIIKLKISSVGSKYEKI